MSRSMLFVGVLLVLAGSLAGQNAAPNAPAQPPVPQAPAHIDRMQPPAGPGQVVMSWDEFARITGYNPMTRGQTLTIPWQEVEKLLGIRVETVGGGAMVDLPWQDFKNLLEWSVTHKGETPGPTPPTDFVLTSCQYSAVCDDNTATFLLQLKLDMLRKSGWKELRVLDGSVAILESKLPDGVFLHAVDDGYELLTDKSGPMEVSIKFTHAVQTAGGISKVSFALPLCASSVLDLAFEGEQVDVRIAGAQQTVTKAAEGKTHVAAALPVKMPIDVTWERALPKLAAAPTKMYAETRTLAMVGDGVLQCTELVNVNVLHTAVRELKLQVPPAVSVLDVNGNNIQEWRTNDKNELTIVMRGEVIGPVSLRMIYEQPIKDSPQVPVLRMVGVEREMGYIGVGALTNVEISATDVSGASAIDVRQLPPEIQAITPQPILLGFRYTGEKLGIPLAIKHHEEVPVLVTVADSTLFTSMQLMDGRRITKVVYSVRNNRNQFLRLKLPAGAEIWSASVSGSTVSPAKDDQGRLLIPLIRSAGARELASFPVEMVYVETPAQLPPASGKLHVALPTIDAPIVHVMVNYYLPAEGNYTITTGLFGRGLGFSGPLRVVSDFTTLSTRSEVVVVQQAQQQVDELQKQANEKADAAARAAGAQPIRVQLPVKGKLFKLEKVLALPGDPLWFDVQYKDWTSSQ